MRKILPIAVFSVPDAFATSKDVPISFPFPTSLLFAAHNEISDVAALNVHCVHGKFVVSSTSFVPYGASGLPGEG